jgi:hypothetical protein
MLVLSWPTHVVSWLYSRGACLTGTLLEVSYHHDDSYSTGEFGSRSYTTLKCLTVRDEAPRIKRDLDIKS